MQDCPHCGEEIQEEAVFCRYCRRDVDPPMWLTSMQKCSYCAEWIERGLDTCPLCGKELVERPTTKIPPFTQRRPQDFATDLRQRVGFAEEPPQEARPSSPPSPSPSPSEEETIRVPPFTPQASSEEDASLLRRSLLGEHDVADGLAGIQASRVESEKIRIDLGTLLRRVLPILLGGAIVVAVVILAMGPGKDLFMQMTASTPTVTGTPPPIITVTVGPTRSAVPEPTETPQPSPIPTLASGCVSWEQVSLEDEGKVMCVYGVIKRWFASGDIPFVAIFSEELGTFSFVDYNQTFSEAKPGTCIVAEGTIEVMRGTRPFIDLNGIMELCPEGLIDAP